MPIYEYRCKSCGEVFEKMMRWSESDRSPVCPNCQGADTHKQLSTFASHGVGASGVSSSTSGGACGSSGRFS